MVAVDTNILVYSHRSDSPFHVKADAVVTALAEGSSAWAIAWPCLHEFLAIVTHPRIYKPPTPVADALVQVERWLESPTLVLLHEEEGYWAALRAIAERSLVTGGAIHDARIAALCRRHGVATLYSADRDFSRFPDLTTENPLLGTD
jgi:toxin-antitoxin system PIN domain toxin